MTVTLASLWQQRVNEASYTSAGITAVVLAVAIWGNTYINQVVLLSCVYVVGAVGVNILRAQGGLISFGQGAVLGVAGYVMSMSIGIWEIPIGPSAAIGFASGMLFGTLLSIPSLRVQTYYLAFVTLAGSLALPEVIFYFRDQTRAMTGINVQRSFLETNIVGNLSYLTILVLVVAIATIYLALLVKSSRRGRQIEVAGVNPEAAETMGIHVGVSRIIAFAIANVTASAAGVLYVLVIRFVAPNSFTIDLSILLYFVIVIGGVGTIAGPVAGVVVLYLLPELFLGQFIDYRLLVYGVIALIIIIALPEGIVGGIQHLVAKLRASKSKPGLLSLSGLIESIEEDGQQNVEKAKSASTGKVLLAARDLRKSFGASVALDGVDIDIAAGELHAVVGMNGSGKTTLLNALNGLIGLDTGEIYFEGDDITSLTAVSRSRKGIARTFQTPRVLTSRTVWENVDVSSIPRVSGDLSERIDRFEDEWRKIATSSLPHSQRRMLEVIRCLNQSSKLIALDEPAAGLSAPERKELGQLLKEVVRLTGTSIVMVEHDLEMVWGIADTVSLMDVGRVVASGSPHELRDNPELERLFAGSK